jgi:gamma-glutamyltranspeptidase/glutathione hydrolase
LQEAVDAPRFHQQWLPDLTVAEPGVLDEATRSALLALGHRLGASPPANHVTAIALGAPRLGAVPPDAPTLYGANDGRRNTGLALGY